MPPHFRQPSCLLSQHQDDFAADQSSFVWQLKEGGGGGGDGGDGGMGGGAEGGGGGECGGGVVGWGDGADGVISGRIPNPVACPKSKSKNEKKTRICVRDGVRG